MEEHEEDQAFMESIMEGFTPSAACESCAAEGVAHLLGEDRLANLPQGPAVPPEPRPSPVSRYGVTRRRPHTTRE
jgi:hypothetical protein